MFNVYHLAYSLIMAALRSRCRHYILQLWLLSSFFLLFFIAYFQWSETECVPYFHTQWSYGALRLLFFVLYKYTYLLTYMMWLFRLIGAIQISVSIYLSNANLECMSEMCCTWLAICVPLHNCVKLHLCN